jgi:hypothetical protein
MVSPVSIEPRALYDDGAILLTLGFSSQTLARARRAGKLRYTRQGRRTLYLGEWLLAWLEADTRQEVNAAR